MNDPDSTNVNDSQRSVAKSVGSLSYLPGHYVVKFDDESFWNTTLISTQDENQQTMRDYITHKSLSAELGWHSTISQTEDYLIPIFKKYNYKIDYHLDKFEDDVSLNAGEGHCTGFLIQKNILMTNNHCIATQEKCDQLVVRFNEEKNSDQSLKKLDAYKCEEMLMTDKELDVSILRLMGEPGNKYGILNLSDKDPASTVKRTFKWKIWPVKKKWTTAPPDSLYLIGHPGSHPDYEEGPSYRTIKKVTNSCNATSDAARYYFSYSIHDGIGKKNIDWDMLIGKFIVEDLLLPSFRFSTNCPAVGGMSGSPVFNSSNMVIGIMPNGDPEWVYDSSTEPHSQVTPMSEIIRRYSKLLKDLNISIL